MLMFFRHKRRWNMNELYFLETVDENISIQVPTNDVASAVTSLWQPLTNSSLSGSNDPKLGWKLIKRFRLFYSSVLCSRRRKGSWQSLQASSAASHTNGKTKARWVGLALLALLCNLHPVTRSELRRSDANADGRKNLWTRKGVKTLRSEVKFMRSGARLNWNRWLHWSLTSLTNLPHNSINSDVLK